MSQLILWRRDGRVSWLLFASIVVEGQGLDLLDRVSGRSLVQKRIATLHDFFHD